MRSIASRVRRHRLHQRRYSTGGNLRIPVAALALATLLAGASCRLFNMRPLEVTGWSPEEAVVTDPHALGAVSVTFSALVDEPRAESAFSLAADGSPVSGRFEWDSESMRFVPDEPLKRGIDYVMTTTGEAQDVHGNALVDDFEHTFSTRTDFTRPSVERTVPADGAVLPTDDAMLAIEFSEPVDRDSFYDSLSISPPVTYAVEWSSADAHARIRFMEALTGQQEYAVSLDTGVTDLHGNTLAEPFEAEYRADPSADSGDPEVPELNAALASFERSPVEWLETNPIDAPELTLYPGDVPESTAEPLGSWERFWGVELHFNTPVSRSDVEAAIELDPERSVSVTPRFAEYSDRFVLSPDERFAFARSYTVRLEGSIRSDHGTERQLDSFTRFRADGSASRPGEVRAVTFLEDPAEATIVGPLVDDDELDLAAYGGLSGDGDIGFFDLYLAPAEGASFNRFEVAEAVSFDISNIAADIELLNVVTAPVGEAGDLAPSPDPLPGTGEQIVRITVAIEDLENSGLVTIALDDSLADSYGNEFAEPWKLRLNQVSSP